MVDRYYRKIESVENDIENAMQISSILLKLKEYDEKLGDLSKIGDNENDISSNLLKISTNEEDIASNLLKITTNEEDISSNSGKISTNVSDISSNLKMITANEGNISSNLEQITDIKSLLPASEIFKNTYNITNQSFKFNSYKIYFRLLEIEVENNFNINEKLEFDSDIYYKYNNLQKDHHQLQHEYRILVDKNNLLHRIILNKTNSTDLDFDKNIMLVEDDFILLLEIITIK